MKLLVLNGPNLNMLGIREKEIYGSSSYKDLIKFIKSCAKEKNVKIKVLQSNYEGTIVYYIQRAYKKYDGIIINPGAYTHYSYAILDALKAVNIPTVEVHLSDINDREEFRKISVLDGFAKKKIVGKGFDGYKEAIEYFNNN